MGRSGSQRVSAPARRPLQIPGKTPRRRFQPGGGCIPTLSGRTPALGARCASRVPPASGSITQRRIPPERGAAGLGHEGGLRKLPPREAGWWAVWEAASEGDRRRMTARRPDTGETGGDHAGAGELEPGRLGMGHNGNGGRAAAPWPGGRGKAPGVLRLSDVSYCVLNLTLPLKTIPKLVRQDSGLLWLLFLILSPLSLYLFISPSPVIFVLCLIAPCLPHFSQSVFLFQFLPISVSRRFSPCLRVPLCFPSLFLFSSLICLSQSRSLVFSLRFHFPVSGLVPCLPVSVSVFLSDFLVSLAQYISP